MNEKLQKDASSPSEYELLNDKNAAVRLGLPILVEADGIISDRIVQPVDIYFPPILRWWGIVGVEATQSIQYFSINGQGSGAGTNNSVPMVANKELLLRVYPGRFGVGGYPAQVTGVISRAGKPDLVPVNNSIPVNFLLSVQRGSTDHSLNFRIPAADCVGTVTFTAKLIDTVDDSNFRTRDITLTFEDIPQIRIHGVLIHYTGKDSAGHDTDIAAPSGLDLINTLAWTGRAYPIKGFYYTQCEVIEFDGDLTNNSGTGCGAGWNGLFSILWNMRAASGTDDIFVGLLPNGVPTGGVIGCGGGGVAIAYNGGSATLAEEIGHAFGRKHAPCGNPGNVDPDYPTYNSYPSASIGEFGIDTSNLTVFNPASTYDFMSYCGPAWISPYTYVGLKNTFASSAAAASYQHAIERVTADEYLCLNFRMYKSGKVDLLNSFHLHINHLPMAIGKEANVRCDLLDQAGEVITSHQCRISNPRIDENGACVEYHELIPWSDRTRSIAFLRNNEVCDRITVEDQPPQMEFAHTYQPERAMHGEAAQAQDGVGLMRIEWQAQPSLRHGEMPPKPTFYLLRYSNDAGKTWRAVAADLKNTRYVANLDMLPGGEKCMFQVVASSGITTSSITTDTFVVPRKHRTAHILSPEQSETTFKQGQDLLLLGGGFSPDFESADFEEVTWSSDRDGLIGKGYQVITNQLSPGQHQISVSIPDGLGGTASASVVVIIQ